jgi:hypothetical protein
MARLMFVCAGLALLCFCVSAEEKPAKENPVMLTVLFDEATLNDVMAKLAADTGYNVVLSRDIYGETPVSLDIGRVSMDVACVMIEQATDLKITINPARKVIEVQERGARSAFTELMVVDTRRHQQAFIESRDKLGPMLDANGVWHEADVDAATYALQRALYVALAYTTDYDHVALSNEGLTAHAEPRERESIDELFGLLLAEGGGRSRWLETQAATWEKLSSGVLTFEAKDVSLADVLQEVAKKLGVTVVLDRDARDNAEQVNVNQKFDKMPALDVLNLLLEQADLGMLLVENMVYVLPEDRETFRLIEAGYAVYELDALIADRQATSKEKSDTLAWDIYDAILGGLCVAIDRDGDYDIAQFGTRVVVRGDMRCQKAATDYLTAMGWKAK